MSNYKMQSATILFDPITGVPFGFYGGDGKEYAVPFAPVSAVGVAGASGGFTSITITASGAGVGTTLTNPLLQATHNVNNFTQVAIQNLSAGTSSSSDHICYPNNNTNDLTGFADIGITSSLFADAAYTVTGQNEGYVFSSAPSGASKSGSLVLATDSTGTNNNIEFYVGGFTKAKTAFSARILGTNGLLQVAEGLSLTAKTVFNNGATTTYTIPAKSSYVYLTTSAASLTVTLPAASANIDGLLLTFVTSASVATLSLTSSGATFAAAPTSAIANTPIRLIYNHAGTNWLPA